jgi:hypothetical protein
MKWCSLLLLSMVLFSWSSVHAESLHESSSSPSLVSALRVSTPLAFCGEQVPIETPDIRERFEKELLLTLWRRHQVILWLKRSRRYLPLIEEMLRAGGMPDDLKYIAIAESALRPHAGSKKGAMGFWQFMKGTGRKYGLRIDSRIDERRNIVPSTQAAIRYFKDLYQMFGSWTLAAAAYNMGEEALRAEILEQGTNDYYHLYLPLETQRYVFMVLSAKLIISDTAGYGFNLADGDYYPPVEFDPIQIDCAQDTPIRIIAQAAKTHFKRIKDLNPEVRGHYLPKGRHNILIPKGTSKDFHKRYQKLVEIWLAGEKESIYVVKEGDSLSAIAERFQVPLAALIIWNRIDLSKPIHPGDELIIHRDVPQLY